LEKRLNREFSGGSPQRNRWFADSPLVGHVASDYRETKGIYDWAPVVEIDEQELLIIRK
jgi:hypothetical protein